jgi:hypothetical protein
MMLIMEGKFQVVIVYVTVVLHSMAYCNGMYDEIEMNLLLCMVCITKNFEKSNKNNSTFKCSNKKKVKKKGLCF